VDWAPSDGKQKRINPMKLVDFDVFRFPNSRLLMEVDGKIR